MAKITDNQIAGICREQISKARTYSGYVLQDDRAQALKLYDGRELGNEVSGRSSIVSQDLTDMVHATIAQLQPMYSGDCLAEFEPIGQDDDEQAKAESAAVNAMFVERNQGFYQSESVTMDALLQANGTLKVWIEDTDEKQIKQYRGVSKQELNMLQSKTGGEIERYDEETGDAVISLTVPKQRLLIERINPEDFYVYANQTTLTYEDTTWLGERRLLTRSDLVEMGYNTKMVSELGPHTWDREVDQQARYIDGVQDPQEPTSDDRAQIEVWECYLRITDDGKTGISHLERVMYSDDNNKVLGREVVDMIPYASGTGFLMPGRWYGQSLYHKLRDIVYGKTRVLRQWLDGNEKNLKNRTYVSEDYVNFDDLLNSRMNGAVRIKGGQSPQNVVMVEPVWDAAASAQAALDYFDKIRAERCGSSMDIMSPEAQTMENISGVSAQVQLNSREMMASKIARTLSETLFRNTYLLIHETLRRQWSGSVPIKVNGQWTESDPAEWRPRDRVNMKMGVSPAERSKRVGGLQQTLQTQMALLQGGGANVIVNLNNIHRTLMDLGKAQGLDSTDSYFMDPESPESQQAQQADAQAQQQQGQMQQQLMGMQLQMEQQKQQLEQQKAIWDKENDDFDNETDRLKLAQEYEIKEAELTANVINGAGTQETDGAAGQGQS